MTEEKPEQFDHISEETEQFFLKGTDQFVEHLGNFLAKSESEMSSN